MRSENALRWLPWTAALVTMLVMVPVAWGRGFGSFMLANLFVMPGILVAVCGGLAWAFWQRDKARQCSIFAAVFLTLILTFAIFFVVPRVEDWPRYWVWAPAHQALLREYALKSALVEDWQQWGMAGAEYNSYLVSSPFEELSSLKTATIWVNQNAVPCQADPSYCDVVDVKRMQKAIYLVTTFNSPLQ